MNISQVKKILPYLLEAKIAPLLVGHKGIGKSEIVKQFAASNGYTVVDIKLGNLQDPADLLGLMEFIKDEFGFTRTVYARPSFFPTDPNAKVLFFFDELNRCNKQLIQPVMELALERRHLDYVMPENCRVVAAMNPYTDDYLTNDISDAALLDRFCQIKLTADSELLYTYLTEVKGVDAYTAGFVKERFNLVNPSMTDFELEVSPSARKTEVFMTRILPQNPPYDVLASIGHGWLGVEATTAFTNWLDQAPKAVKGAEILNSYSKVKSIRERVLKYVGEEGGRVDMISATVDDMFSELKTMDKGLNKLQRDNLLAFVNDLPPELVTVLLSRLWSAVQDQGLEEPVKKRFVDIQKLVESDEWEGVFERVRAYRVKLGLKTTAHNQKTA